MSLMTRSPVYSQYENNWQTTPAASLGTSVSHPAGAPNTKNTTWTQLIASSAFDAQLVVVTLTSNNAGNTDTSTLLDIGIGASTAESVIIPDLLAGFLNTLANSGGRSYVFPLHIPAGSRISARTQCVRTSGSVTVSVQLFGGADADTVWVGQHVTAYGINTADSGAVAMTAGNSGAETATPIAVGTTSVDHKALVLGVQGNKATYSSSLVYHVDVGIDTSSTEWLVRDGYQFVTATSETVYLGCGLWLPMYRPVPSGTTLVVAGESSGTSESLDYALYGIS